MIATAHSWSPTELSDRTNDAKSRGDSLFLHPTAKPAPSRCEPTPTGVPGVCTKHRPHEGVPTNAAAAKISTSKSKADESQLETRRRFPRIRVLMLSSCSICKAQLS